MRDSFDYPQAVTEVFDDKELTYEKIQKEDEILFAIPLPAKNAPGLKVFLHVSDDGDCKFRSYLVREVPERKFPAMFEALNRLNGKYRYITLSMDSDGDVLAAYDFTLFGDDMEVIEQNVMHMLVVVSQIMDKCIKPIMKIVWFDDDED